MLLSSAQAGLPFSILAFFPPVSNFSRLPGGGVAALQFYFFAEAVWLFPV